MTQTAARWLESLGATRDVVAYAETVEGGASAFWAACPRGDWLLAIALRTRGDSVERRASVLASSCAIAELGLDYLPDDDALSRSLLSRAASADGAPLERDEIDALERDAEDAADPAVAYARRAIVVCARAAQSGDAADLEDLALVPALVSQAAAHDAGDCAMLAAASFVLRKSAELVRAHLGPPE